MARRKQTVGGLGIPTDGILTEARTGKKPDVVTIDESVNVLTPDTTKGQKDVTEQTTIETMQEVTKDLTPEDKERAINELAVLMHVSPDTIRKLQTMSASEAEKFEAYAGKVAKGTKDKGPFAILPIPDGMVITLGMLHPLSDFTEIPNVKSAIRPLDRDNVERLRIAYSQLAPIPPLALFNSTWGIGVIAGNHRRQAQLDGLRLAREDKDGKLSEEAKAEYLREVSETPVNYVAINGKTPKQLRDMAFFDNLTHGKQVSKDSMSRYVIMLWTEAVSEKRSFNVQGTCNAIGVSRQAVYQQIDRDTEEAKKALTEIEANATLVSDSAIAELKEFIATNESLKKGKKTEKKEQKEAEKANPLNAASEKLFPLFMLIAEDIEKHNLTEDELAKYFKPYISNQTILSTIQVFCDAMSMIEFSDEELAALKK